MPVKTEAAYVRDVVRWEVEPTGLYTRKEVTFKNDTGETASFPVGQTLMTSGAVRLPAPAGDSDGILLTPVNDLVDDGEVKVAALVKGPAVVNQDALVFLDGATVATQKTDLIALGIDLISEPTKQTEG
jgi:hypothetical protein